MTTNYNERSWAIDIISEINAWASSRSVQIRRAGGENTITSDDGSLFPDVLLYGDLNQGLLLQGWELKMPDTPINDPDLLINAERKANLLGLDSFLVWNVSNAQLFTKNGNQFELFKSWNDLSHIRNRDQVFESQDEIFSVLHSILDDLGQYFINGVIRPASIINSITGDGIVNILFQHVGIYANELKAYADTNSSFEDEVVMWWLSSRLGYPENSNKWKILAETNLLALFNKFVFTHVLKGKNNIAYRVDKITNSLSVREGLNIFQEISTVSDYWNILSTNLGEEVLPDTAWNYFLDLNAFLRSANISSFDVSIINTLLNNLLLRSKRKVAGQFVTPAPLAGLITRLVIEDAKEEVIDPCCGTGTIVRSVYDFKKEKGITEPLNSIWGSDKFFLPLRLATFSLSIPDTLGKVLKIFQKDIIDITPGNEISLSDPNDGKELNFKIPRFQYVLANLPFVRCEDIAKLNPGLRDAVTRITAELNDQENLDSRSDLYAYLPFYIWSFLKENGRVGIIISNSWLATKWGIRFFELLRRFYKIESIITSGSGRWFREAKVVTNIVILRKKADLSIDTNHSIKFITLKKRIDDLESTEDQTSAKSSVNTLTNSSNEWVDVKSYNSAELDRIHEQQIPINSLFTDITWLLALNSQLIPLGNILKIGRGERRGWDPLFFPSVPNQIESNYLKPVLKTPQSIQGLLVSPDRSAFCCENPLETLRELNHFGAIHWIESFETLTNEKGKPLPSVLARPGTLWYTMHPNTMGDFVTSINPGDRIFFGRFDAPTFVNQRLIWLSKREVGADLDLMHALLNSITSMFFVEALGFGRGEGVLDLSATKIKEGMRILDPSLISTNEKTKILFAFSKLLSRNILPLEKELEMADRKEFDIQVLDAYGLSNIYNDVKSSLLGLYRIRNAVKIL